MAIDFEPQEPGVPQSEPQGEPQEQSIPYQRFEQVYGKMKDLESKYTQFKEFGDPGSVKERLNKLAQWEKTVEEHRQQQAKTPDEQAEAQRAAQIKKELLKVYPELADVNSLKELKAAMDELKNGYATTKAEATLKEASMRFSDTLKAAKIDSKYQDKIEEYIVSQMSDEERQEFVKGNYEIAERIFNNELKDGLFSGMRAKPNLPTPMTRNTPGGTPPNGRDNKPKTLQEAAELGFALISNRE
jgi:hypothetical protein